MSLYGMMHTGSSGMNAQANRLSAVGENIANANTVGYKRVSTEFSTMLLPATTGAYNSGGVQTQTRYSISESVRPTTRRPRPTWRSTATASSSPPTATARNS